jgi:ribosome-associated protein
MTKELRLQAKTKTLSPDRQDPPKSVAKLLNFIQKNLDDNKALEPTTINLAGKSSIADYLVIVSGTSARHVAALADQLSRALKDKGFGAARIEGMRQADWVLMDVGDIIVHVFRSEVRDFYNLEKMWSVDLEAGTG